MPNQDIGLLCPAITPSLPVSGLWPAPCSAKKAVLYAQSPIEAPCSPLSYFFGCLQGPTLLLAFQRFRR